MGYTTKFKGILKFAKEPTVQQIAELSKYLGGNIDDFPSPIERGKAGYIQFKLTEDFDGIQWDGSEKFYGAVDCVNWLTNTMRRRWPDFAFVGELQAQGEEAEDRWRLVVNESGTAKGVADPVKGKQVQCPKCRHKFIAE
jgi:hypothetical protein